MSKYTIAGLVAWLFSALLLGFQAIATFMGVEDKMIWKSLTLVDVVGRNNFIWIERIAWAGLQNAANYIVTMPLFILLFIVGIVFFLINRFKYRYK
jgi:hypothetical protein